MPEILRFASADELAAAAARRLVGVVSDAQSRRAPFVIALSGGRIARPFYESVVAESARAGATWTHVRFCFADERCVPPDHPDSNFAGAQTHLFAPLGLAPSQVLRLRGEIEPAAAVVEAERALRQLAPVENRLPVLDLVWLGMGEDGHVASLFPNAGAEIVESRAVYLPVIGPKPPPRRLTLTFAMLAAARDVWVLATGPGKQAALAESLRPGGQTPLARVLHARARTTIFTDLAVA